MEETNIHARRTIILKRTMSASLGWAMFLYSNAQPRSLQNVDGCIRQQASLVSFSKFGRRMVKLDVVQGRPVPRPVLLHDPLAEGVEPVPGVEPSRDRPEMEHHQEGATIKIELLSSLKQAL